MRKYLYILLFLFIATKSQSQVLQWNSFQYPAYPGVVLQQLPSETGQYFLNDYQLYNLETNTAENSTGTAVVNNEGQGDDFFSSLIPSTNNYTVGCDFIMGTTLLSTSSGTFGVEARLQVPNSSSYTTWTPSAHGGTETGYMFMYSAGKWTIKLVSVPYFNGTTLGTSTAVTLAPSTTYRLQLVCNGTSLSGYVNGVLVASATDSTYTNGTVGVEFGVTTPGISISNFLVSSGTVAQTAVSPTIPASTTGATLHVVGNNTAWVSGTTTFSVTGVTGLSVASTTIVDNDHATLTLNSSTTTGTFTLSDSSDTATTTGQVIPPSITYASSSTYFGYSPINWYGDLGRTGSTYMETWNTGAYFKITTALGSYNTSMVLHFSTAPWGTYNSTSSTWSSLTTAAPYVVEYIDGSYAGKFLADGVNHDGNPTAIVVGNAYNSTSPNSIHTYMFLYGGCANASRWETTAGTAAGVLRVTGITLDGGASITTPQMATKWALVYGTSISEGFVTGVSPEFLQGYSWELGQSLISQGYELGYEVQYGDAIDTGYPEWPALTPNEYRVTGGVYSDANSRWDKVTGWVSNLDANGDLSGYGGTNQMPSIIWVEESTNDIWDTQADLKTAIQGWMTALRTAAPGAKILAFPISTIDNTNAYYGDQGTVFSSLVNSFFQNYETVSNDHNFYLFSTNTSKTLSATVQTYPGGTPEKLHPSGVTHPYVASQAIQFLWSSLGGNIVSGRPPLSHGIVH